MVMEADVPQLGLQHHVVEVLILEDNHLVDALTVTVHHVLIQSYRQVTAGPLLV